MQKDNFKQTFLNETRNEVQGIYLETTSDGDFNADLFSEKLSPIWTAASLNGLDEFEFISLVEDIINKDAQEIYYPFSLNYKTAA
ncbi:hypothetical protein ABMA70_05915 [Halobacteriovorax sp. XZX-3]|uniref:hypothetical protein n=1 Tax=unclassified Halobacteriovorax TaxID=2639665 RepID=UPI000CD0FD1C|nr:hypothetical protein [Halobacteriovorax sp. DA5]POB14971.1 hypothetical protein C0Z22_00930 [Halobacteriovorax sp. DA5]